jgi:hypothetical protein
MHVVLLQSKTIHKPNDKDFLNNLYWTYTIFTLYDYA